jgi:hypothetical protein
MRKELDNFIIESDMKLDYFDEIINHIIENEKRILEFFELKELPEKVKIMILSYESFKEFVISKYGEILEYVSGDSDSKTRTIRILNVEDQIKYTTHKDETIEKLKATTLHEIVHQCHRVYHCEYRQIRWFAEGLATNISNQDYNLISLDKCDFNTLKNDFSHYENSYKYAHTIVNFILNNYSKEEITRLYKDPNYLREKACSIFEEAKIWVNDQLINNNTK